MKKLILPALLFLTVIAKGQTKLDTNKYYLPFKVDNLNYLSKQVAHIDSVLVTSTLLSKDSYPIIQFLNSLQDAFLQNYKIQVAEMEKKKGKP